MNDLARRLDDLAAAGEIITYGALARDLGWRIGALTTALEGLMEDDIAAGHPLRAAVCAGRLTNGMPAEGFFIKALALGLHITDRAAFVSAQRAALNAAATAATSTP